MMRYIHGLMILTMLMGNLRTNGTMAQSSSCSTPETYVDYRGNDIKGVSGSTPGDCCTACQKTLGCVLYVFNPDTKRCWLKRAIGTRRSSLVATSAATVIMDTITTTTTAVPTTMPTSIGNTNCPVATANADIRGNDIKGVSGTSTADCCLACQRTLGCKAYVFNPVTQRCWLKSVDGPTSRYTGASVGVLKIATTTTPAPTPTPSYTCPVAHVQADMDYPGNDIRGVAGITSIAECCAACRNTRACIAYVFNPNSKMCWLKKVVGPAIYVAGVLAGVVAAPAVCTEDRVRMSWDAMSLEKKNLFKSALQLSMQRGLYQRFVKMHIDDMSSKEAHGAMTNNGNEWSGSCVFMFWHRKYLLAFENMLRSLGDLYKCVTVPYLDYVTDYNKQLTGTNCAGGKRNFLACSAAAQELGGVSGTFRSTKPIFGYTYADLTCVKQSPLDAFCPDAGAFNDRTKCDRCVPRTDWSRISIPNDVSYTSLRMKILSRSISSSSVLSFQNWSSAVEYEPHNMIHATLSGPMSNALIAPTDPIFFLHHATMDLLQTIYFHCRIEPKRLTDNQLQNDPMVFQGCTSRNNHLLGVNSTVFMRESGSSLRADEHPATASYFRNIPTAYFRLTDTTRLGPGLSYKYKIEGPLGQVYQECDNAPTTVVAAASVLNAMESMTATATAKQSSSKHEVLHIFRAANVKMQDLEVAVLAAAQRQGLTLEEGQAELQKMIVVAHQACVPGGVKDISAPLQASGSRFAVAPSPSYQLWKSIEAHETPMRIFQWAILLKEFLGCDAQAVLKLPA